MTKTRFFLAFWLLLVVVISVMPLSFKLRLHTSGPYHPLAHYIVYGLTGILLWFAARGWRGRALTFLFGLSVAFTQEWLENHFYHAGFEWRDVFTDLAGLLTGYAAVVLISALTAHSSTERTGL